MADKETPQQTIDRLNAELEAANAKVADYQAAQAKISADEIVIREKMSHGLTREQAIHVIKSQRAHDVIYAEQKKKAEEAAAEKAQKAKEAAAAGAKNK